ncbi:MAG: hypothetical protein OXG83_01395 [Acidobacteria bacterium]|nr:hypothetical protein [Acidobacteriota bacterium]
MLAVGALPAAAVDFDAVAEVFRLRCTGCHHEGGPAPFALENFEQARAWSSSIRRAVAAGVMPPWHADPRYGEFSNDRRLPAAEKEKLLAWIDGGSRRGSGSGPSSSTPGREPSSDWRIGVPDLIYELPEDVTIPASGTIPYHGYRVETKLPGDVWIQAAETQPGNAAVVHHVIVQAFAGSGAAPPADGGDPRTAGDLGGYAPGTGPLVMPPGVGRRLPAGAVIDFQMHYTPTGRAETDRSRIGLVLASEPPRHESRTALCTTPFLFIPAGEKDVRFEAELSFPRDSRLLSLRPHMHLRGDTFEFRAAYPDGRSEVLLRVNGYDFNWQTTYRLAEPKPIPAGTKLHCVATYDNSSGNPDNPDPTRNVSWGRETTDEMMIGFVDYYEVD